MTILFRNGAHSVTQPQTERPTISDNDEYVVCTYITQTIHRYLIAKPNNIAWACFHLNISCN